MKNDVNLQSREHVVRLGCGAGGCERRRFEETFQSDAVTGRMMESRKPSPTLSRWTARPASLSMDVIITNSGMTGGVAPLLQVLEELVQMVREERRRPAN